MKEVWSVEVVYCRNVFRLSLKDVSIMLSVGFAL